MSRKLASVQTIINTEALVFKTEDGGYETAQNIVKAYVLGWQCVTQRANNFKAGDKVVYFEVDSLLPAAPEFEFLRKKPTDTQFRIKTIKLKGHFAQGLILPLSTFENHPRYQEILAAEEGTDLTDLLGVEKWEPEISAQLAGMTMGEFPAFVHKTDETRIQAVPEVLIRRKGTKMYLAEKLDGSSTTLFYVPYDIPGLPRKYREEAEASGEQWVLGVCSRNLSVKFDPNNAYWKPIVATGLHEKIRKNNKPIVMQGELYGEGVQKNKLKLKGTKIGWYNVVNPIATVYYDLKEFEDTVHAFGEETVPIIERDFVLDHTVEDLVKLATRKSVYNSSVWAEGLVFRPEKEAFERNLGRLSFKVINPEFSLKYDE